MQAVDLSVRRGREANRRGVEIFKQAGIVLGAPEDVHHSSPPIHKAHTLGKVGLPRAFESTESENESQLSPITNSASALCKSTSALLRDPSALRRASPWQLVHVDKVADIFQTTGNHGDGYGDRRSRSLIVLVDESLAKAAHLPMSGLERTSPARRANAIPTRPPNTVQGHGSYPPLTHGQRNTITVCLGRSKPRRLCGSSGQTVPRRAAGLDRAPLRRLRSRLWRDLFASRDEPSKLGRTRDI